MKIAEAAKFAELTIFSEQPIRDKTKTALELAKEIFAEAEERQEPFLYLNEAKWSKRWLPSKIFTLIRLPLNAAALPCQPKGENLVLKKIHAREEKPIVVDYNQNQVGSAMNGFVPPVVVIDGKHRFKSATLRGDSHIMAWVGEVALHEMQAMGMKLNCCCGKKVHAFSGGGGGPAPERTTPSSGAKLVAEGKKIKQMNVEEMESGGPGSGRHKEGDRVQWTSKTGQQGFGKVAKDLHPKYNGYKVRTSTGETRLFPHSSVQPDTNPVKRKFGANTKSQPAWGYD